MTHNNLTGEEKIDIVFYFMNRTKLGRDYNHTSNENEGKMVQDIIGFFKEQEDAPRKGKTRTDNEPMLFKWMRKKSKKGYQTIKNTKSRFFLSMLELLFQNIEKKNERKNDTLIEVSDVQRLIAFYQENKRFPSFGAESQKEIFLAGIRADLIDIFKTRTLDERIVKMLTDANPNFLIEENNLGIQVMAKKIEDFSFETNGKYVQLEDMGLKRAKDDLVATFAKKEEVAAPVFASAEEIIPIKKAEATDLFSGVFSSKEDEENECSATTIQLPTFDGKLPERLGLRSDFSLNGLFSSYDHGSDFEKSCIDFKSFYTKLRRFPKKGGKYGEIEEKLLSWFWKTKRAIEKNAKKGNILERDLRAWEKCSLDYLTPALIDLTRFKELCLEREKRDLLESEVKEFNALFSKRNILLDRMIGDTFLEEKFAKLIPILRLEFKQRDGIMREIKFDLDDISPIAN